MEKEPKPQYDGLLLYVDSPVKDISSNYNDWLRVTAWPDLRFMIKRKKRRKKEN